MDNKLGPIRILIRVILSGRSKFSLVSKAIKPDVVGKRIKLIRTNDPYTDLSLGIEYGCKYI
jgi:hypothetical protein